MLNTGTVLGSLVITFSYRLFAVLIFFLSSTSLQAADFLDPMITAMCQKKVDCNQWPGLFKQSLSLCEISKKSYRCDEFVQKNPEYKKLIRNCDPKSYCSQNIEAQQGLEAACWKGYKNAVVDLGISIKETALSFADFIDKTWERNKKASSGGPLKLQEISPTQNINQKSRLAQMTEAAVAAIEKTNVKYNCLTPLVQAEMRCYAIGTVFDPTLIAGYAAKVVRAARVVAEVSETARIEAAFGFRAAALKETGQAGRVEMINKYLYFSPTTEVQNKKFMALALDGKPTGNIKFVSFENAELTNLNQTFLNKNLVTSLTNYHKDLIFSKMEILKKEFPTLEMESYSDYKSARFAFKGQAPPGFDDRLAQVFAGSNQEFRNHLIENKIISKTDAPQTWVRAGVGPTADQANFATRFSRTLPSNQLQSFASPEVKTFLADSFQQAERLRLEIASELSTTSKVFNGKTLDADAFNIVRKNGGDSEALRASLIQRYGLKDLSSDTVKNIQAYAQKVDQFSPDLLIAKREVASLEEAKLGGLSADMVGMGAQNLRGTAEALTQSKNVDEALTNARQMEQKVTSQFNVQRGDFQAVVSESVGPARMKTICSGDDCVSIAKSPLTDTDKSKILQGLAEQGYSSKFRISFIPEGIKDSSARTSLATHGEAIEKKLQQNLAEQIEPSRLKGLIFGVDMQTKKLNKGSVKLLVGASNDLKLSVTDKVKIQQSFETALKQMNEELKSQGTIGQYQSLP